MQCKCGKKAVFFRECEGNAYCKNCFCDQVRKSFGKTVRENELIQKNDVIAVGVSGGKDSSVLLHLLVDLQKKFPFTIKAITIDEGIAGYRNKSIEIVKKFCSGLGAEHFIFSFKEEFKKNLDEINVKKYCTCCGVFRRHLLNKASRKVGADKLAIGHNMDDEAQSILLSLIKGERYRFSRLGARPRHCGDRKFVPRIKPLRNIPEKEITAYALLNKIPFHRGECPYSKDNMRREVLGFLDNMEKNHPGTKLQVVSFYDSLQKNRKKSRRLSYCARCGEPSSMKTCMTCSLLSGFDKT